jgi:hypothetical protein
MLPSTFKISDVKSNSMRLKSRLSPRPNALLYASFRVQRRKISDNRSLASWPVKKIRSLSASYTGIVSYGANTTLSVKPGRLIPRWKTQSSRYEVIPPSWYLPRYLSSRCFHKPIQQPNYREKCWKQMVDHPVSSSGLHISLNQESSRYQKWLAWWGF